MGLSGGATDNSPASPEDVRNAGSVPGSIPWGRDWQPTPDPLGKGVATHSSILAWRIPVDREAWRATVDRVEESQTQLKQLSVAWHGT